MVSTADLRGGSRRLPQDLQYAQPMDAFLAQSGHWPLRSAPHERQNLLPSSFSESQRGQVMLPSAS